MDDNFPTEFWHSDLFWLDVDAPILVPVPAPARHTSAFAPYLSRPAIGSRQENNNLTVVAVATTDSNFENIHKRVIAYWRKHWHEKRERPATLGDLEREKCHRHMLNERMRREKQRHSYLALHSILPAKTKNDKNTIVQMATRSIEEMRGLEGKLKRRNSELEMAIEEIRKKKGKEKGRIPIRVAMENPSCGINSMLAVLNVLQNNVGVNTKAIQATFFNSQFSAQFGVDTHTQMRAAEVERALQVALTEADTKFQKQFQEGSQNLIQTHFNFNINNNNTRGPQGGSR